MTCRAPPGLLVGFLVLASGVVADHAEGMGIAFALQSRDPAFPSSEVGTRFREAYTRYIESNETDRTLSSMLWGTPIDAPYRQTLWQRAARWQHGRCIRSELSQQHR